MNADTEKLIEEANAAGNKGDYQAALNILRPLAHQGNAVAEYYLGEMYEHGLGVTKNPAQARGCYRKSASQGFAPSQVKIALMYYWGIGVERDHAEAIKWYRKSAAQGDAEA